MVGVKSEVEKKGQGFNRTGHGVKIGLNRVLRWKRHLGSNWILFSLSIVIFIIATTCAVVPGIIAPHSPLSINPGINLASPSWSHPFGTDQYGRDILSQIVYGAREALIIGFLAVALAMIVGGVAGLIAGTTGGFADMALMRLIDVLMAFPGIVVALLFVAALGPSLSSEIIAVAIAAIPSFARVTRGQVLMVRSRLYVEALKAMGITRIRLVVRHILPNSLAPIVVLATIGIGNAIVLGSALNFLGLGPTGGIPDWGRLLAIGEPYISTAWWITTFPGLAITLLVVAANIIGDWLRDRMDVAEILQ